MVSKKRSMEICKKLDQIAAELRKVSAAVKRQVNVTTHVHGEEISVTVDPEFCRGRLEKHIPELQRITISLGKSIFFHAETNKAGDASSVINAAGYRKDHFFSGYEKWTYGCHEIEPEQVVFGEYPIGLEETIMQKELRREMQKRKKK